MNIARFVWVIQILTAILAPVVSRAQRFLEMLRAMAAAAKHAALIASYYVFASRTMSVYGVHLSHRRSGISTLAAVLAVIIASVALVVGVFVIANLQTALSTSGLASSATVAIGNIFTTTYNAFNLLVVAVIVLAAVAILSIIVGGLGAGGAATGQM